MKPRLAAITANKAQRVKALKSYKNKSNSRSGQTVVEYVLTIAIMTAIFGTVFNKMRISLFQLWVCQIGPRIESPNGCGGGVADCWTEIGVAQGSEAKPGRCTP